MRTLWGIADPEQLTALAKLLEEYAQDMGISGDQEARDRLAERILALVQPGCDTSGNQTAPEFQSRSAFALGRPAAGGCW